MLYVFLFTFFSLPLIFTLVAASISHFIAVVWNTTAIKCPCYRSFQRHWPPLFFISRSSSFSVIHVNAERKTRLCCCWLSLKSPDDYALYRRKTRVLEMQNFTSAYMKGWTYVWTIFSEPKYFGCIDNHIFLPMVLRCARFALVRAPLQIKVFKDNYWIFWKFSFFKYLHLKCFKFSLKITHLQAHIWIALVLLCSKQRKY